MKTVNVEMFEAEDGELFPTANECLKYESLPEFTKQYFEGNRLGAGTYYHYEDEWTSYVDPEILLDRQYEIAPLMLAIGIVIAAILFFT